MFDSAGVRAAGDALVWVLAALVAEQAAQLTEQAVLIGALRVELEALRRQVGRDSSRPPSTDGPGAKATAKAGRRTAGQQAERPPAATAIRGGLVRRRAGLGVSRVGSRGIAGAV